MGMSLLDQMHVVLRQEVKSIGAHLQSPASGGPDRGFLIYMSLRNGGWAICQATTLGGVQLPHWVVYAPQASFTVDGGLATVSTGGQGRTYEARVAAVGFWENLYGAVRNGAELKCHPADIVRAMKWHEAAFESDELREPVAV